MRNIMQGMEAFYRQGFMLDLIERIKSDQVRDTMTGLYNYEGFVQKVTELMDKQTEHYASTLLLGCPVKRHVRKCDIIRISRMMMSQQRELWRCRVS